MYHTLDYIQSKPSDFKICKKCGCINWYENKECHLCKSSNWYKRIYDVNKWIEEEILFHSEQLTPEEVDDNFYIHTEIQTG